MDNNKKFKYIGFVDFFNSCVQIGVAAVTTGLSMYFILVKGKYYGLFATYVLPALNLIGTMATFLINVRQMKNAKKLIRAGKENVCRLEKERAIENWKWTNIVTCVAAFIWFLSFGIASYLMYEWCIAVILALFFVAAVSRGLITWGMYRIGFEEELEMPVFPADVMDEFMEVQRQRNQQQLASIQEPAESTGVQEDENL